MAKVVGCKVWYADPANGVRRFALKGRDIEGSHAALAAQWAQLPASGVQVVMLYYDEFSPTPSYERYRRIMQGNDRYWLAPGLNDAIYGQGNESADALAAKYPGVLVKEGAWIDDDTYKSIVDEAMADMDAP